MNVPLVVLAWGKLDLTLDCRATIAAHAIATHAYVCALSITNVHARIQREHTQIRELCARAHVKTSKRAHDTHMSVVQ